MKTGIPIRLSSGKAALAGWNGFDCIAGNMWTDDRQRCVELVNLGYGEARAFNSRAGLAIRMAAVTHSPPERFHRALDPAEQCSGWRSHVLNKDELAAGSKHPQQFRKCPTLWCRSSVRLKCRNAPAPWMAN